MISRNKLYSKRAPEKEGKLYFIFCEGERRETTYFYFFNRIASQIIIQIVPIEDGRNSPMGLYSNALKSLLISEDNPNPNYSLTDADEVWFIIDSDKWGNEINTLRQNVAKHNNWFVAQSNPCFEVWLYYHIQHEKPKQVVDNWKDFLNDSVKGGFDNRKHPVYIETAIANSKINFSFSNNQPDPLSTEVHVLGEKILPLVKPDIDLMLVSL